MNTIEIYYFSGTGNSLHVAKELQKRMPGTKLIPIVSLLNKNVIETGAETVGFVFPTYLTTVPAPVRKFIQKLALNSTQYIFSITTRIGSVSVANIHIEKALKKKGKPLNSAFILNMANNSPTGLKPIGDKDWVNRITKDRIAALESEVQDKLDMIQEYIMKKVNYSKKVSFVHYFFEYIMSSMTENIKKEIPFYADTTCTGCGICEKVCLSNKIRMVDNKPVWAKDVQCYFCYACFNFCPVQSILIKKLYTEKNGRYHHPQFSANDIGEQKSIT